MSNFAFGIITVPKRAKELEYMVNELHKVGFKDEDIYIFNDEEMKGQPFNFDRMLKFFCDNEEKFKDTHIFMSTDDVEFKEGWFEKYKTALETTNYPIITGFVNKVVNTENKHIIEYDNFKLVDITGTGAYYDVCNVWRKGTLNKVHYNLFRYYAENSTKIQDHKHYDICYNNFLNYANIHYALIMKNAVTCLDVRSVLKHNIKINKDL